MTEIVPRLAPHLVSRIQAPPADRLTVLIGDSSGKGGASPDRTITTTSRERVDGVIDVWLTEEELAGP
eukprot:3508832-Pyramimonas_sp.AAC.1